MIYGYIRVSTGRQTLENQRFEIENFCRKEQLFVDGWIEETVSGTCSAQKRKLGELLGTVQKEDLIICTELSRLGRSLFMIMESLNICMERGCRVWTLKEGYRLGDDIQSKVLAFAFGLSAEIERKLISERTREALARRKSQGMELGRKRGSRNTRYKLDTKALSVKKMLMDGKSRAWIAKACDVSKGTVNRYLHHHPEMLSEVCKEGNSKGLF